jgi:hypothetical protein
VLPHPVTQLNMNITSTQHIHNNLLMYKREVLHVSGAYHSTSTDGYQLSIAHLVE